MIKESVGHIRFWSEDEFIEINGNLLITSWKNSFDPEGIRYKALSNCWLRSLKSKEELIWHLEECIRKDRDLFLKFIPDQEIYSDKCNSVTSLHNKHPARRSKRKTKWPCNKSKGMLEADSCDQQTIVNNLGYQPIPFGKETQ